MPKDEATTLSDNPESIKASDLKIDVPLEDPEDENEDQETEEAEPDEPTVKDDDEDDKAGETADEEPAEPVFSETQEPQTRITLDEKVAKALPPDVKKRFEEQVSGLEKVKDQISQRASYYDGLQTWHQRLLDPKEGPAALQELIKDLSAHHKIDPAPVTKDPEATSDEGDFAFDTDKALYEKNVNFTKAEIAKARAELKAELAAELGITDPSAIKDLLAGSAKQKEDAAFDAHVQKVADGTIEFLKLHDDEWKVTRPMVATAIKNLPQFKDRPVTAVRKWYSDERAKHAASKATRSSDKGPEALKGVGREGFTFPDDPMELKAGDLTRK